MRSLPVLAAAAVSLAALPAQPAHALSAGCAAWNQAGVTIFIPSPLAYDAGDVLTVTVVAVPGPTDPFALNQADPPPAVDVVTLAAPVTPGDTMTYTVPESGVAVYALPLPGFTSDVSCVGAPSDDNSDQQVAAAAQTAAQTTTTATVGMISGRVTGMVSPRPAPGGPAGIGATPAPALGDTGGDFSGEGAIVPDRPGDAVEGLTGGGGQAAASPIGVWGNFGYTGLSNSNAVARSGTSVYTAVGGADMFVGDSTVFGGAVALSWADTDTPDDSFRRDEFSVTFAPYAAYAIDDVFAIDGSVGYAVGFSDTERSGGVTGNGASHRYFIALNATGRRYWGGFGLYGAVGGLWSQSFQGAYTESDGSRVSGQRFDLGSLSVKLQPSYLIPTEIVTIEPFIGLGYTHDYRLTEVRGAANDRGQMDIQAGINLFGDGVMGGVEVNSGLFRENQRHININGTLRLTF